MNKKSIVRFAHFAVSCGVFLTSNLCTPPPRSKLLGYKPRWRNKRVFVFVSLLSLVLFLTFVFAQPLPPEIENIQGIGEKIIDPDDRNEFLKQKWEDIFRESENLRPLITLYDAIAPYTNPIFKYIIGMELSISWLFWVTLIIWIALVMYIWKFMELTSLYSENLRYALSIGLIISISFLGISRIIAEFIITTLSLFTLWWVQLIAALVVTFAIILAAYLSSSVRDVFRAVKKSDEEHKEELHRKQLEGGAKIAEAISKEFE